MNFAETNKPFIMGSAASDPAAPPAGKSALYFNTTINKYKFFSPLASVWLPVGSGSGSGVDFIDNGDFEEGIVLPFATFNNPAASTPPNNNTAGTGGSPTSTLNINSTTPLGGLFDAIFSKPSSNVQGDGWSVDFTIDRQYSGSWISVNFGYQFSAGFVTGFNSDMQMFLLDKDAGTLIGLDNPPFLNAKGVYQTQFFAPPTSQNFRLICFVATTSAAAYTMEFDNVEATPLTVLTAPSPQREYFINPAFITNAGYNVPGTSDAELSGFTAQRFVFTPKASADYKISLPVGWIQTSNSEGWIYITDLANTLPFKNRFFNLKGDSGTNNSSGGVLETTFTLVAGQQYTFTIFGGLTVGSVQAAFEGTEAWTAEQVSPDASPVSLSEKINMSQLIANGTQVTGVAPSQIGQYRALYRNSGTVTSLADASGFVAPTLVDGFLLYANVPGSTSGTASQPTVLQVFVGFNKSVKVFGWQNPAKDTQLDISHSAYQATSEFGLVYGYDPTTGILTIDGNFLYNGAVTTRYAGLLGYPSDNASGTAYIEAEISNNPLGIGAPSSRLVRSNSTGVWANPSSGTLNPVTDGVNPLQAVLNCDGGDVEVWLEDDGSNNGGSVDIDARPGTLVAAGQVAFFMDGVQISALDIQVQCNVSVAIGVFPPSGFRKTLTPPPGQHTFTVKMETNGAGFGQGMSWTTLCARNMG